MDVVVDPETFKKSKLSPTIIAKVADKLSRKPRIKSPRAKKKWPETVNINGERFVVMCHEEYGKIVITYMRYAKKKKVRVKY